MIVVEVVEETREAEGEAAVAVVEDEAVDANETVREKIAGPRRSEPPRQMMPQEILRQPRQLRSSNRLRNLLPLLRLEFPLRSPCLL